MPKLVDTTIRLLSQEPLAGKLPTAEVLRVAEILDGAGFACLEVSGGGVFDATVRRRVESPWERIRAIAGRVSTPLGIALRGRFLVGSRPVSGDIVGRFVSCAACGRSAPVGSFTTTLVAPRSGSLRACSTSISVPPARAGL